MVKIIKIESGMVVVRGGERVMGNCYLTDIEFQFLQDERKVLEFGCTKVYMCVTP